MKRIKPAELVIDLTIYPRMNVDPGNVKRLMEAHLAGEELPPIIIDKKSRRVIDGVHRLKMYLAAMKDDEEIEVVEKSYPNEAAMFLDAMKYNASHGAALDRCDRTHCAIIAERLSIPLEAVAGALHMPLEKLGELRVHRTAKDAGGLTIPIKQTIRHMAGKKFTKRQEEANDRLSGMNQSFYANQLIELIESKMLDMEDDKLLDRLRHLHGLLEGVLVSNN